MSEKPYAKKIRQHHGMKKHLGELSALTGRLVKATELSSVEQAALIRDAEKIFSEHRVMSVEIPFSERSSERFNQFVKNLFKANPSPIQLWLPRTIDCGMIVLKSIMEVDFSFDFSLNEEGILVLMTEGMEDRLLLDFFSSPTGEELLKVEAQGVNWSKISY